jgi:dihydroflavonol-4-reductase
MILVTGATGHIGNVLVRELYLSGARVRALLLPGEDRDPLKDLEVEIMEGDVLDEVAMHAAMQGVDIVYHLAGLISIMPGADPLVERVNVQGTENVIRAAMDAGAKRLIYTSSIHAIQRVPEQFTIDESIPFDTSGLNSAYDTSKAMASLMVLEAVKQGLDAVVVCPTGVIGPFDYRLSEMGRLILDSVKAKVQFSVDGAYDFVDVRDVARGLIQACERGRTGEHYILSGERITIPKLMATVREVVNLKALQITLPMQLAKFGASLVTPLYRMLKIRPRFTQYALETVASNSYISHAKAARELGYAPRSLSVSIADTVRWMLKYSAGLMRPKRSR